MHCTCVCLCAREEDWKRGTWLMCMRAPIKPVRTRLVNDEQAKQIGCRPPPGHTAEHRRTRTHGLFVPIRIAMRVCLRATESAVILPRILLHIHMFGVRTAYAQRYVDMAFELGENETQEWTRSEERKRGGKKSTSRKLILSFIVIVVLPVENIGICRHF